MKYRFPVVFLALVLGGCSSQPSPRAFCPPMHEWDKAFQAEMAAEIRAHWQECPALLQSAMQLVELHKACNIQ
ncbi:hypothetical protein AA106555_1505 [Neokomagataea thailandica NBRC 106555]|uniref:Lipoprotein n=1 Tax=Neokomagataea thailandica NBRC 106555 TaxID=1223520 RepID=A0ABQ0QR54_9PROT|nr:hypothetical protein [Neokomagataea tanensis]GBR53962.1 hypothetical protein AA106555_1505 [Neokomagataea thailandica NBRC 106555]